jgi:CRISPR/Cas system CMR subunit Cmr6 (Cas7 group RAMP superfamily)
MIEDKIKQQLKNEQRPNKNQTNFSSIKNEVSDISDQIKKSYRTEVSDYQGNKGAYDKNRNRAIIGLGAGCIGSLLHPLIGLPFLVYGGIKGYQAYKDQKKQS